MGDLRNLLRDLGQARDELKRLHEKLDQQWTACLECRHKYFKDFSAFCPYRVGPLSPDGFCEHGKQ